MKNKIIFSFLVLGLLISPFAISRAQNSDLLTQLLTRLSAPQIEQPVNDLNMEGLRLLLTELSSTGEFSNAGLTSDYYSLDNLKLLLESLLASSKESSTAKLASEMDTKPLADLLYALQNASYSTTKLTPEVIENTNLYKLLIALSSPTTTELASTESMNNLQELLLALTSMPKTIIAPSADLENLTLLLNALVMAPAKQQTDIFTVNLTLGSIDDANTTPPNQVSAMQKFLVKLGFLTIPSSSATGYYGSNTATAVKAFQLSKNINEENWGPLTRAVANPLYYQTINP